MNNKAKEVIVLGIESSCDDTSCAIFRNDKRLANVVCSQKIHEVSEASFLN
jgi:N6-L-threonylcarbamoyladenine synthase